MMPQTRDDAQQHQKQDDNQGDEPVASYAFLVSQWA
jgi:hypothetical protein